MGKGIEFSNSSNDANLNDAFIFSIMYFNKHFVIAYHITIEVHNFMHVHACKHTKLCKRYKCICKHFWNDKH